MKIADIEIEDLITGKMGRMKNGDIIILRRSKTGKVYRYTMRPQKGARSHSQQVKNNAFRQAACETTRQLRVNSTRVRWEVSYRESGGLINGKKYTTLRGYVFASFFKEYAKEDEGDGG